MTKIALLGAGGKMGVRLTKNLVKSRFKVDHVEISEVGRERLMVQTGLKCVSMNAALFGANIIVLAVPDQLVGTVLHDIVEEIEPKSTVIMLDAAAPHAGLLPAREDLTYFVTHPCHPSIFNDETSPAAKADYFGGVDAAQDVVCALMQGPEAAYALCEEVARTIYAPVMTAHRCSLENIAILEPAMSETVAATLCLALREATEEAIRRGVPRKAAMAFMLGHLNIELAIAFEAYPEGQFSDGALKAIEEANPIIFRDGWLEQIFSPESVRRSVAGICAPN